MVLIRHRCKICNEYTEVKVSEDDYFKYLSSNNPDDLKMDDLDKLLFVKNICNNCRITSRENNG